MLIAGEVLKTCAVELPIDDRSQLPKTAKMESLDGRLSGVPTILWQYYWSENSNTIMMEGKFYF